MKFLYIIFCDLLILYYVGCNPQNFLHFIDECPSPWHAVNCIEEILITKNFQELELNEPWKLQLNQKYYIKHGFSTLFAIVIGGKYENGNPFSIVATHSDSPSLKLKPNPFTKKNGYIQLRVQLYGSGNWYTWFDRDLYIAGLVIFQKNNVLIPKLCKLEKKFKIPTIAIHLHPEFKDKFIINTENNLNTILGFASNNSENNSTAKLLQLISECINAEISDILEMDLNLVDSQPATTGGFFDEFIYAPRLDNLFGVYSSLQGLLNSTEDSDSVATDPGIRIFAMFDNEEVGSGSVQGAHSNVFKAILRRLSLHKYNGGDENMEKTTSNIEYTENDAFERTLAKSFIISADQVHAIHPNYADRHETNHDIDMGKGMVIKYNPNQKYASTALSAAVIKYIAKKNDIPLQAYVIRNDMKSGSTIGPILSSLLGINTIDLGAPQLSMHSIRETCATISLEQAITLYKTFYQEYSRLNITSLS